MKAPTTLRANSVFAAVAFAILWTCNAIADSASGDQVASFSDAISKGKAALSFRYRYEHVDQDGNDENARASTLRTRLGLESAGYRDWKFGLEFNNVTVIGSERYNSTRNGLGQYPVVADPDGTVVNRVYVDFSPGKSALVLGRQHINRNNQRFIGAVAWRQNEQTYDAFTAGTGELNNWQLDYGYIWQVNRIFGPDEGTPQDEFDSDSHVVTAQFKGFDLATLSAYAYLLDLENSPPNSNRSIGLRLNGKQNFADNGSIRYAAEYATQSDYGDNSNDYSANYYLLELGADVDAFTLLAGWEVLGGDDQAAGKSFRTPLATLHKFQGWADKFLVTPDAGVDDRYVAATVTFLEATASLIYHDFRAESGGQNYGDEWDFYVQRAFRKRHVLLLKYANYRADSFATDTKKWWLQYFINF